MPTLDVSKYGRLGISAQSSHANARDAATASNVLLNYGGSAAGAIQYARTAGRGAPQYHIFRTFYYFDTSGITGTVSAATLNIKGYLRNTGDCIVVPSTAFAGDGSADVVVAEYDSISFNTNYGSEFASWSTSANNSITLASTALANIKDNDFFICAVIEHDHDFLDSDSGATLSARCGVDYDTPVAFLDYTIASGYANTVLGVAPANIGKVSGVATADIEDVIGV